jgi:hypothetical protein
VAQAAAAAGARPAGRDSANRRRDPEGRSIRAECKRSVITSELWSTGTASKSPASSGTLSTPSAAVKSRRL